MDIVKTLKPKGDFFDGYTAKIVEECDEIQDDKERVKKRVELWGSALEEIEQKIIDEIFISEIDLPLYVISLEILAKVFEERIEALPSPIREGQKIELNQLRKVNTIHIIKGL